ncbi:MAG: hypothetical protein H0X33_13065 [Taibaiella sp.]|nr:hypothetical protein [Taibaiella sp.]
MKFDLRKIFIKDASSTQSPTIGLTGPDGDDKVTGNELKNKRTPETDNNLSDETATPQNAIQRSDAEIQYC